MFNVKIERRPSVTACYESMPEKHRKQIDKRIERLRSTGPSTSGVAKLKGSSPQRYRYRSGEYRIIFSVESTTITVLEIVPRKDAYR